MAKTPGSGRKKGTPNKVTAACRELADRLGVSPFEVLLHFAAGDWQALGYETATQRRVNAHGMWEEFRIDPATRMKAAAEASKYLYPQRKSMQLDVDGSIKVLIEDYTGDKGA